MEILRSINFESNIRVAEDSRQIDFTISNETKDRHRTIIPIDVWDLKNFNRAGSFYYQHMTSGGWFTDPNPDYVLGIATAKVHEKELIGSATFEPEEINELAEKIYKKVNFGTLKNTSVGFTSQGGHWGVEKKGEDPTTYYFDHAELLEFSIVNIPSNPDAIKKSLESMNNYMLKEVEKHQSSGFQKDYFRELQLRINKQIF